MIHYFGSSVQRDAKLIAESPNKKAYNFKIIKVSESIS